MRGASRGSDMNEPATTHRIRSGGAEGVLVEEGALVPTTGRRIVLSLGRVAFAMGRETDLDDILTIIIDEARMSTCADVAVLCTLDPAGSRVSRGPAERSRGTRLPESWWRRRVSEVVEQVSVTGLPATVLLEGSWLLCSKVSSGGRHAGFLAAVSGGPGPLPDDAVTALGAMAVLAGLAIETSRVAVRTRSALLAEERERLSRDLHDGLAQSLCGAALQLEWLRVSAEGELAARLERVQRLVAECSSELRRHVRDLRPLSVERLGLAGAIGMRLEQMADGGGIEGGLECSGRERDIDASSAVVLYRAAQECLHNVVRHSEASQVAVRLRYLEGWVELEVEDDGRGLDPDARRSPGHGLGNLWERAESVGGRVVIDSKPGEGARVRVRVPG